MSDTAMTLRHFLLTDQEVGRIYTALDVIADMIVVLGDDPDEARTLRDRFRPEDEECPQCEGTGKSNPLPPMRSGPPPCGLCGGTGRLEKT